jgi:hypothetical protein
MFRKIGIATTKKQWARASEILGNIGILSFVSIGFPLFSDGFNFKRIVLGIVISMVFWYYSFYTARKS